MLVKTRMLSFGGLAAGASLAVPFWLAAAAGAGFFPFAASYTSYCKYRCWSGVKTCVMLGTSSIWSRMSGFAPFFLFVTGARRLLSTTRSEEHTSELQSQSNLVCRLLLET